MLLLNYKNVVFVSGSHGNGNELGLWLKVSYFKDYFNHYHIIEGIPIWEMLIRLCDANTYFSPLALNAMF